MLYLLGAGLFVFAYSALAAGMTLLPLPEEIRTNLSESGANWAGLSENLPYQLLIHLAAGFLFGILVTVYAVISWPVIAFSGATRRVLRRATALYAVVVAVNMALVAALVAAG
ncbi:hypothetical protein GE300_19220 [Rhodobacteraceae bacterium 2CG4]|uniref:Uncharacterized protein n=1 Tax=Halovulum marinum TaxID=2662447 RepID=A0A6L5Z6N2_9RHOB|nr:hypothetical protein [Halovulum marinum]MSU91714.1 hypothetical protein [Halovulum marinum]